MPRRRHENKARSTRPLTLDELHMWDAPGAVLAEFGSAELAREEWGRRGHLLRGNPGTRPEAWWTLFAPKPLHHLGDGPLYVTEADWNRVHRLQVARAAWILEHPEQLDGPADREGFARVVRDGVPAWTDPGLEGAP